MSKMTLGDALPAFRLQDQDGQWLTEQDFLGQALVLYFYPKDDTPGCTAEACAFRDQFEVFTDLGAKVVGVSADGPEKHKKFASKHRLPFRLLSDSKKELRKKFGVPGSLFGLLPGRVTYIFNAEGKLIHEFSSQFNAVQHIEEALESLKKEA
ncbi:peroxiredoxin [Saprospira sp. CCB-QB6]|uniref:peroxiredoxin n=1 Tax=Saprospira sp. CCB-QB6 TaxID=3023936 RepID=UPI00234BCBE1|nr:peroxiredoxin [Saprospira sp. CCB-QB6]WCL81292.1 peroxiredoxin [Saprospira sp. CCB-QB6]